jgi:hypothetical protein
VGYLQHLPEDDAFPESYSDLSQITWITSGAMKAAIALKRLTPASLVKLQRRDLD